MLWLEKRKLQLKNLYRIMSAYCPRVIFTLHLAFQHAIEGRFCCMYTLRLTILVVPDIYAVRIKNEHSYPLKLTNIKTKL